MVIALVLAIPAGCARPGTCDGEYCGTVVFAAVGEPVTLLPPLAEAAIERDIGDQLFLKLADIGMDQNTIGDAGFEPQLADRWAWTDPLTLVFHLDPRARWHDGRPVSAGDVAFSFAAYTDTALASPLRESLRRVASMTATDSATVTVRFRERYPEMFYDAVYHLRVLPEHLLGARPRGEWRGADFARAPVGNGPYRFGRWVSGQRLELAADSAFFLGRPTIRRLIWRFNSDLAVAVTQVVADEADAIEVLVAPPNIERAAAAEQLTVTPYAGSAYTVLAFNLRARGDTTRPHPILADAELRRALVLATDRERMLRSVFGPYAKLPPAPIPQMWASLWFPDLPVPPWDTAGASRAIGARGWRDANGDGVRERAGRPLTFAIALPSTSGMRRQYARLIQEQLRAVGVQVTIEEMDPPALQEALRTGNYDAALMTWGTDPAPSSGFPDMWRSDGAVNFGRYRSPVLDAALARAEHAASPEEAARAWHAVLETVARDAPAIVLNAPDNVAAIHSRFTNVRLRPDSYWAYVRTWRVSPDRLIERDRAGAE
jgi:peptide/nickel transport system substrate-binding protein